MPQLFPPEIIENTVECYHAKISTRSKVIYWLILLMLVVVFVSLPLIYIDVSTQSRGIVRSPYENTTVQSALMGEVVSYRMSENKSVQKGDTLIVLNTDKITEQIALANKKIQENNTFISDIALLLSSKYNRLASDKYKSEYFRYLSKINEHQITVDYLKKELSIQKTLFDENVISKHDYLQTKNNYDKATEQLLSIKQDYQSNWVAEQTRINQHNIELASNIQQLEKEKSYYIIQAPISGTLIQVAGFQKGNYISASQNLAYISSNNALLAECYISPSDIGYISLNQAISFQFDAFNYREWGMVHGTVEEILNDIVLIDNKPMFRVRCSLNKNTLGLKNGYEGTIQKGLTFTARFYLNRRNLWQLLFDKIDNWLNPKLLTEKQ